MKVKSDKLKPGMVFTHIGSCGAWTVMSIYGGVPHSFSSAGSLVHSGPDADFIIQPNSIYEGLKVVCKMDRLNTGTRTVQAVRFTCSENKWSMDARVNNQWHTPDTFWTIWKLPEEVVEMTLAQVCEKLGKTVKIVKETQP